MTNRTIHLWLIVVVALAGLAVAIPAVSAHGTDTTAADAPVDNATAGEWAAWMEGQMIQHMGPDSVEWMESHMGVTVEEMGEHMANSQHMVQGQHMANSQHMVQGQHMANADYPRGTGPTGGMSGQAHC